MALFEKKTCDICGDKLGLTGKKKAADGILCKGCASRLSPWTGDIKEYDLRQLRSQLVAREANRQAVADFTLTRSYGDVEEIQLDATRKQFMLVTTDNVTLENPDVFDFDAVLDCSLEITEDRIEDKQKDEKGKLVSFNPPRYHFLMDFILTFKVQHPCYDTMTLKLNRESVSLPGEGAGVSAAEREKSPDYRRYSNMAEEIRNTLLFHSVPHYGSSSTPSQADSCTPAAPAFCPSCGTPYAPGATAFCTECGTKLS
ncbi:MAG: DUF4428 domain-containing protein [Oscillospiraceae bacterium]|nr:DUF4428 domain-containing protein [Oscillospiraceae bacterium]